MAPKHRHLSADFRSRLRSAREAAGLTLADLAERTGYKTKVSISNLELGKQSATLEQVENLARALGVRVCWLAYGEGPQRED